MESFQQKELVVVKLNPYIGSDINQCEADAFSLLDKLSAIGIESRIQFHFNGKDIILDAYTRRGDCWKQLVGDSTTSIESLKWDYVDKSYNDLFSVGVLYPVKSYHKTMVKVLNNKNEESLVSVGDSVYGVNCLVKGE